jgi:hypothetical protein
MKTAYNRRRERDRPFVEAAADLRVLLAVVDDRRRGPSERALRLSLTRDSGLRPSWADPLVAIVVAVAAINGGTRTRRGHACTDAC